MCYKNECVILRWILLFGVLFFSLPPKLLLLRKKNSLLFSLFKLSREKKALQKKKKEKRYACHDDDDSDDDAKFSSHSLATKIARRKFLFAARLLAHSFFVVLLLSFGLLSSHYFSHFLARHWGRTYVVREERGRGAIFLLGLLRVKNVVGVLVADANAWMQILNFKCVRRVRLRAKEGLNCSSRLAVMMLARRVIFSHRVCDKDLSLTTLLLFSLLFHSYKTTSRTKTNTYIHINYAAKIRSKRRHRSFSSCHRW